jgi:hypothetical protein
MRNNRIGIGIVGLLIAAISISSCTYRSHVPVYDNGYGYGYGHRYYPPPPRRVVVVRPTPPPKRIYRSNGHARPYDRKSSRSYNRNNSRQYGHNGRTHGPR